MSAATVARHPSTENRRGEAFILETLVQLGRYLIPHFRCELRVPLTCGEVEERLRGSLRIGWLRDRIEHPFIGTVGAEAFKIAIDTRGEDSPTYIVCHIEESDGESRITIFAKTGIINAIGTFALSFLLCAVVGLFFGLGKPTRVFLATIGGAILVVPIHLFTVRQFWEELDETLVDLLYVLGASVTWRSHNKYGAKISHPNPKPRQE